MSDLLKVNTMLKPLIDLGRIGVLMGGISCERDISLKSGRAVVQAFQEEHCDMIAMDITEENRPDILRRIRHERLDVAFIALHGELGEDGQIQGILDELDIPFIGSDQLANQKAFNKSKTLKIFKKQDIPSLEFISIEADEEIDHRLEEISFSPWVVKPSCEGSSFGINIVLNYEQLRPAIHEALAYGHEAIVERYIKGREFTVSVLGQSALPVIEIIPKDIFFNFSCKYDEGRTEYIVPASLPFSLQQEMQSVALKAHRVLGCSDLSRVDIMMDDRDAIYVLELNTIPGFTSTSLLPKAASQVGLGFNQLCLQLIRMAYGKKEKAVQSSSVC